MARTVQQLRQSARNPPTPKQKRDPTPASDAQASDEEKGSEDGSGAEEGDYEVEKILADRFRDGVTEYRVKWKNFPESENSWEPEENLDCPELLAEYEAYKESKSGKKKQPVTTVTPKKTPAAKKKTVRRSELLLSTPGKKFQHISKDLSDSDSDRAPTPLPEIVMDQPVSEEEDEELPLGVGAEDGDANSGATNGASGISNGDQNGDAVDAEPESNGSSGTTEIKSPLFVRKTIVSPVRMDRKTSPDVDYFAPAPTSAKKTTARPVASPSPTSSRRIVTKIESIDESEASDDEQNGAQNGEDSDGYGDEDNRAASTVIPLKSVTRAKRIIPKENEALKPRSAATKAKKSISSLSSGSPKRGRKRGPAKSTKGSSKKKMKAIALPGDEANCYNVDGEACWLIERVIGVEVRGRKSYYLVKWDGYPDEQNSWEPIDSFAVHDTIHRFTDQYGAPSATKKRVFSPEGEAWDKAHPNASRPV